MVTWHPERALTDEEIALNVQGKGAHVCDYLPATSEPYGDIRTAANRDNDYWMDWEAHRTRMFCGIPGFGVQDQAIQESQGDTVDRTRERLGTSDTAIIQVRRRLMTAARALRDQGAPAPAGSTGPCRAWWSRRVATSPSPRAMIRAHLRRYGALDCRVKQRARLSNR
jgi:hypothetical protein